ncbi:MAG: hypothetical protein NTX05_04510 [Fusobacteria bacterium]|nr:hypothetical protein [Fusobacteriota bacterium]
MNTQKKQVKINQNFAHVSHVDTTYYNNSSAAIHTQKSELYRLTALIVATFIVLSVFYTGVVISNTRLNMNLANLNKNLFATELTVSHLHSAITMNMDLDGIQKFAETKLGMVQNPNYVYMALPTTSSK